jgi:hypothetical protein
MSLLLLLRYRDYHIRVGGPVIETVRTTKRLYSDDSDPQHFDIVQTTRRNYEDHSTERNYLAFANIQDPQMLTVDKDDFVYSSKRAFVTYANRRTGEEIRGREDTVKATERSYLVNTTKRKYYTNSGG